MMFLLACVKPMICALRLLAVPMPDGSSAAELIRLKVDKRWVDVAMAELAADKAFPAIKALMLDDPVAMVLIN